MSGDNEKRKKEKPRLTVIPGAEATSDDDGQLGDVRARDCADHLCAILRNAALLRLGPDHVTGNIHEEEQRDLALGTQLDEVGCLERRMREEDAVVRYDTHGEAVDVCEPLWRCRLPPNTNLSWGREEKGKKKYATVTMVCPYSFLNSRKRLPSTTRAITSRMSNGWRRSVPTIP
jgi:hypothetical protein